MFIILGGVQIGKLLDDPQICSLFTKASKLFGHFYAIIALNGSAHGVWESSSIDSFWIKLKPRLFLQCKVHHRHFVILCLNGVDIFVSLSLRQNIVLAVEA